MTMPEKIRFVVLRSVGNFLLLMSLYGVVATFGPPLYQEVQFKIIQARGIRYTVAEEQVGFGDLVQAQRGITEQGPTFTEVLSSASEQVLVPKDPYFSILIPKIGASAKVFPNVDPTNDKEFIPVLRQGVAHAKGTVFPGFAGNTYLFAHSTDNWWDASRYNAVFYLLKELQKGDDVVVYFENKRYNYIVRDSVITDPTDTSLLVNAKGGEQRLILQTCWPPGTTWKRLFVLATPKGS